MINQCDIKIEKSFSIDITTRKRYISGKFARLNQGNNWHKKFFKLFIKRLLISELIVRKINNNYKIF